MNFTGFILAVFSFVIIGVFHPIVIKCEYHFSDRIWPAFLVAGLLFLSLSVFAGNTMVSCLLGVLGITFLWSIGELKEQKQRVQKGWFPKNPKRDKKSRQG